MNMPNEKTLKKIRENSEAADPSYTLPSDASHIDRVKYDLCQRFVKHILENKITQKELSNNLNMDPARLNEIVKYKIHLFTLDKLFEFATRLDPNLQISVA